mmetsp:Transcript_5146/g.9812  ORF Transcript_5146/g.9812 Transcript_5146/m.9812 type:complete len:227 (+) Transcript_5146:120-800(+)
MILVLGLPGMSPAVSMGLFLVSLLLPSILGGASDSFRLIGENLLLYAWLTISLCLIVWWFHARDGHPAAAPEEETIPTPRVPEDIDKLVNRIRAFPIEEYCAPESFLRLGVKELCSRLDHRSIGTQNVIEKIDLAKMLTDHHSAQQDTCSICFEAFSSIPPNGCLPYCGSICTGDCGVSHVRVLPSCGHFFHVECIDRWAFAMVTQIESGTTPRRAPTCPLCNVPL